MALAMFKVKLMYNVIIMYIIYFDKLIINNFRHHTQVQVCEALLTIRNVTYIGYINDFYDIFKLK